MRIASTLLFLFIISCASQPEPEWIYSQSQTKGYWIGIGIVEKPIYGNDCREEARNQALLEISSQISVEVTGSFEQVVTEHNLTLDEFAKSVIQTRVDNNLPNIEIIEFYDSKSQKIISWYGYYMQGVL